MIYVLTPAEMRAADAQACEAAGERALMRNAGRRIAELIRARYPHGGRLVAFAGPGNNGGDAFAAFDALGDAYERTIYADRPLQPVRGVNVHRLPERVDDARAAIAGATLAIDALFGTGARLPIGQRYHAAIDVLDARERDVLAIDIPSGIDASNGDAGAHAVRATVTLTLAAAKPGLLLDPARAYAGELWIADIGIEAAVLAAHARTFAALDDAAFRAMLPHRAGTADKRSAGAPLLIAGSAQFPGAAVLCARAAARAGAGYVTVATPSGAAGAIRAHLVEQVVVTYSESDDPAHVADELLDIAKRNGSIAIGPGLGLDTRTGEIVRNIIARAQLPVVADASALFHMSKALESVRGKAIVITPHAGEFARISGLGTISAGTRLGRLREFVDRTGITTLLKGRDTLIYDGQTMHVNTTGTSALATAGSGDVLTGIIATLLSQGLRPADAARAAAFWHGLTGSVCQRRREIGTMAGDLPEALAEALIPAAAAGPLRRVW